jgi:FtsZ-binding cell division protein ZapB
MTEQDQLLIDELKKNIRRLIDSLELTKAELSRIKDEKLNLENELNQNRNEHQALLKRYENLKVAKALAEGDPENQAAKHKINKILREVDKCIALLNQ